MYARAMAKKPREVHYCRTHNRPITITTMYARAMAKKPREDKGEDDLALHPPPLLHHRPYPSRGTPSSWLLHGCTATAHGQLRLCPRCRGLSSGPRRCLRPWWWPRSGLSCSRPTGCCCISGTPSTRFLSRLSRWRSPSSWGSSEAPRSNPWTVSP
jgi:hypothetical protein